MEYFHGNPSDPWPPKSALLVENKSDLLTICRYLESLPALRSYSVFVDDTAVRQKHFDVGHFKRWCNPNPVWGESPFAP